VIDVRLAMLQRAVVVIFEREAAGMACPSRDGAAVKFSRDATRGARPG